MKTKIIIFGAIFVAVLMALTPCISATNGQVIIEKNKNISNLMDKIDNLEKNISLLNSNKKEFLKIDGQLLFSGILFIISGIFLIIQGVVTFNLYDITGGILTIGFGISMIKQALQG